jgi:hypothetical protein
MATPWEEASGPSAQKGSPEYKLISKVKTTPEEDAIDAQVEAQPWVKNQLDREIANTKDPKKLALLQEEKTNRGEPTIEDGPWNEATNENESAPWEEATTTKPSEGFRALNRGISAAREVEEQTAAHQPKDFGDRAAGALGVVSGVPLGVVEFTASAIQNTFRALKFPFTESDLSDENMLKIMSQPTVAQEIHKMMAEKYPMFDTGMSQVNAPFSVEPFLKLVVP